jgi:sugar (pentulose or hexulose) kinase
VTLHPAAIDVVIGLDIGTTTAKALIRTTDHVDLGVVEAATVWQTQRDGRTEIEPDAFVQLAIDLIGRAVRRAEASSNRVRVRAVAVAGLAESGVLMDPCGTASVPAIAWFDHRGDRQLSRVRRDAPDFAERFERVTGLPWNHQASLAKLLWLQDNSTSIAPGSAWLSVPEWIVHRLGGDRGREASLASRTGLIDQNTGRVWDDAVALAGLPDAFLPPEIAAGQPYGRLDHDAVPAAARGAVLTVAGHDHPVAALGAGAAGPDELFNSCGTADVLARSAPGVLTDAQRLDVIGAGWSAGRHVLPDTTLLLAGVSGGLLLRRVLNALGCGSPEDRARLDELSSAVTLLPAGLSVTGDGRSQDDVVIRLQDDSSPAAVWTAATRYAAGQLGDLLGELEKIVGPHSQAVAAGGWTRMASVRTAKAAAVHALTFSPVAQPGITGAALLAAYALTDRSVPIRDFLDGVAATHPCTNPPLEKEIS